MILKFISLAVAFLLAFIAMNIVNNKGYYGAKIGFFFYGLVTPIIALIHANILPDKTDSTKRQFSSKAVLFNVLAEIFSVYGFFASLITSFEAIKMDGLIAFSSVMAALYSIMFILDGILPLLLVISILLIRKYRFSQFVYGGFVLSSVINLVRMMVVLVRNITAESGEIIFYIAFTVGAFMVGLAYVLLFRTVSHYGIKGERLSTGKFKFIFIAPALLIFFSIIVKIIGAIVGKYMILSFISSLRVQLFLTIPTLVFLGLFYLYDSQDIADK